MPIGKAGPWALLNNAARCLLLAAFLAATPAYGKILAGRVVKIQDGDTLTILDGQHRQHKIRLAGIDSPERKQPFYAKARESLARLAHDRVVTVDFHKIDKYGRPVGKVTLNGRDLNLEQVRLGLAWHYKYYENEQSPADRKAYAAAELDARARGAGLWQDKNPMPPWEWRKRGRKKAAPR